jgi:hypothetical protein
MVALALALDLADAAGQMRRDHGQSKDGLDVRTHDLIDPANLPILEEQVSVGPAHLFSIETQGLDSHVETDFVAVLETIRERLLRGVQPDLHSIDSDSVDTGTESRLGKPEDADRDAFKLRDSEVTRQGDVNSVRHLGCQSMVSERRDQTNDRFWNTNGNRNPVRVDERGMLRQPIQASFHLLEIAAIP